jgi:uncharacterized membrane protein YgdD (TMEM256/DUF423 family)
LVTARFIIRLAAIFGFLGVGLGAFGTHTLGAILDANGRRDTYETAIQYQLVHAVALLGLAAVAERLPKRWVSLGAVAFAAGIVLFSGSLMVLAVFNIGVMGAIAPLGGGCFLLGWFCLGWAVRGAAT